MRKLVIASLLVSSISFANEEPKEKKPYEVFLECQSIATTQFNKSFAICGQRWKTDSKERCMERVERVFEIAMQRCDRLIEKCDNWFGS